mmetsp:Transcript_18529/g.32159  ORF Transcript_18529/g.32159 Transcript_18529/m.32159 type:complete len:200 (+) Transcript_18529:405-1004(+)
MMISKREINATSKASLRLVAATKMLPSPFDEPLFDAADSRPSKCRSKTDNMRLLASCVLKSEREEPKASTSSMKITALGIWSINLSTSATRFSASPNHLLDSDSMGIWIKGTPDCAASTRAMDVLPTPGLPVNKTARGRFELLCDVVSLPSTGSARHASLTLSYTSGCLNGSTTVSSTIRFTSSYPQMSSQSESGNMTT